MFDIIRDHQLYIMSSLTAICVIIALFVILTKTLSRKRRTALVLLELGAACLLEFDRCAYLYRGVETQAGYWWVRVSNFMVFSLTLFVLFAFNLYLKDLLAHEGELKRKSFRLAAIDWLLFLGEILIIFSQESGIYYTFDEHNRYQRGPLFLVCYTIPLVVFVILLSAIVQLTKKLRKGIRISLFAFALVPLVAALAQIFTYGISLTNMSMVFMVILLYVFALMDSNEAVEKATLIEINQLKREKDLQSRLFDQTVSAFVGAIDAKDKYTKGHSSRVAKYAKQLAKMNGKDEEECQQVYYAALLHEIGKIGIPDSILTKDSALTDEEHKQLKQYPNIGRDILKSISEFPYLSVGAHYHHERYDGTGYPDGLSGEKIPEIARIIAVADAYDTMTSQRSYRDPIPQQKVREEIVKGTGTQFDPVYAKLMLHMIDLDSEYKMQERVEVREFSDDSVLDCGEYRDQVSEGVAVTANMTNINIRVTPKKNGEEDICMPAIVLFDSLDARVHTTIRDVDTLNYYEYGELWFDGHSICSGARNMKVDFHINPEREVQKEVFDRGEAIEYRIRTARVLDHMMLRIDSEYGSMEAIVALPDNSRFVYIGLTGENCHIDNVHITREEKEISEDAIPRIAGEVSYINRMEGDVPNIQVDGYRTASTEGVEVTDGMEINFHAMHLPTARLVWHCPFVTLFYSDDKMPNGENYKEYALIRLDGEAWETGDYSTNKIQMRKRDFFDGWESWKEIGKIGYDSSIIIRRKGNKITTITSNNGIDIRNVTTINDGNDKIYVSLTGDQVALTDIRIRA